VGQQDPPGETEEAKPATGAVDSLGPDRRSIGPPHLHLRRHHGWQIETTFQELRAHLGLETTRGCCAPTVLRAAPCLFGLYTILALLYQALPESKRSGSVRWPGKEGATFSDALAAVRRWLWSEGIVPQAAGAAAIEKVPEPLRNIILSALAPAA
jgi:hypothetical protein